MSQRDSNNAPRIIILDRPLGRFSQLDERLTYSDATLDAVRSVRARAAAAEARSLCQRIVPDHLREDATVDEDKIAGLGAFRNVTRILNGRAPINPSEAR